MNFSQALEALKQGKKVARAHWGGYWFIPDHVLGEQYGNGKEGQFSFNDMIVAKLKDDAGYAPATPYQEDILAEDWEIV